jgi:hypothetical protein
MAGSGDDLFRQFAELNRLPNVPSRLARQLGRRATSKLSTEPRTG